MASSVLPFLILSSLLITSFSLSSTRTISGAATALSKFAFTAMALTLEFASDDVITQYPKYITIFSPSDAAFRRSGQPSLSLLQLHFCPFSYSLKSLQSLPYGFQIPTLSQNHSLMITSSPDASRISLNGVKINQSAIYNSGSVTILGIDKFLDPNFKYLDKNRNSNYGCVVANHSPEGSFGGHAFDEARRALTSKGFFVMATLLDLQVFYQDDNTFTLFAPADKSIAKRLSHFGEYPSIFRQHLASCRVSKADLVSFHEGTLLRTYSRGFMIRVIKYGNKLMLNKVPVTFPDMYKSDWLVVHGIGDVLREQRKSGYSTSSTKAGAQIGGSKWFMAEMKILMVVVAFSCPFR